MMQVLFPHCAGMDVHKQFVMVCRMRITETGEVAQETQRFGTMTRDLEALATWLAEWNVTHVAMESTGVYWLPIYNLLEEHFQVWLVNAGHVKQVPGRKTDVNDAQWLAQLLQHGLLKPSFIPDQAQRDLREIVRYRQTQVEERQRVANRIQKVLEDANIKLAAVATDIQGVSAQAMLRALLDGEEDPAVLADLAQARLRQKRERLEQALTGQVRDHHRFVLGELLDHLVYLDGKIATLEERMQTLVTALPGFAEAIERLDTIPGVARQTAILLVAEMGVEMAQFPSDKHLAAWAGLAPGNNQTGGKQRPARTRKGNRYLRRGLVQAAHAAARKRGSYLKALYHRIAARRGAKRAIVAVARTILQIAYHLLERGTTYEELGEDYFDQREVQRTKRRLVNRLEALGFTVNIEEPVAT
jgi:transposase